MDYELIEGKTERLVDLCQKTGATRYISGPAAKSYMDVSKFDSANIEIIWKDYTGYPEYKQMFEPFTHAVSIIDLLFNTGNDAPWYIWGWRED